MTIVIYAPMQNPSSAISRYGIRLIRNAKV
jgi:hypothetical protein